MTRARSSIVVAIVMAAAAAGCAGGLDSGGPGDCYSTLVFSPSMPIAGDLVRVEAALSVGGSYDYDWSVTYQASAVPFDTAQANGSAIEFTATSAGVYRVQLTPSGGPEACPQIDGELTVLNPSGNTVDVRLHVTPPAGVEAVPIARRLRFMGGGDYAMGPVVLEPGVVASGAVFASGVGAPAYLRFAPVGNEHAVVEAYTSSTGTFTARVLDQAHQVLVIPTDTSLAPARLMWTPGDNLDVGPGAAITGTVVRGGTPVANAKVQLAIDGVPTTLGTTAGDGTFSVRGTLAAGRPVKVVVTPPAATGLPRLEAEGMLDPTAPVTITYAALTLRDVGGATVRRLGVPANSPEVTLVGTATAGTVTAGTTASATGIARVAVTAGSNGALPSALAPAWALSAVVEVAPGDLAVSAFNLTAGVPATIDAPPMLTRATAADFGGPLDGARLSLVPAGPLALAGATTVELTAGATGAVTADLASGGTYDVVWSDPAGRAGQRVTPGVAAAALAPSYTLSPPLHITGTLSVTGSPNKLQGAAVEVRCNTCTGLASERPVFEVTSDAFGEFDVTITDPAPM